MNFSVHLSIKILKKGYENNLKFSFATFCMILNLEIKGKFFYKIKFVNYEMTIKWKLLNEIKNSFPFLFIVISF